MPPNKNKIGVEDDSEEKPKLICVEYPGRVRNVEKMLETLGGLDNIAEVAHEPNRRLELRFRPDDVFSKPTCGERISDGSASFLVKVSKYKNKKTGETKLVPEFRGNVETNFKFMNLCDFQYLPMMTKDDGDDVEYENIYDKIYMKGLESSDWLLSGTNAPLFLPPAAFSRMDVPQDYQFRREAMSNQEGTPYNIIGRTRQRRSHHAIFVTFEVDQVPKEPRDFALNQLKLKFIDLEHQKTVKRMFEDVPIWSKNALHATTKIPPERLKIILPSVSYYFTTGPWRNQWVKFGYDPRTDPEAASYQTLDYRVRLQGGARHKVKAKRSYANYLLPYKAMNWSKAKTSIIETFDDSITTTNITTTNTNITTTTTTTNITTSTTTTTTATNTTTTSTASTMQGVASSNIIEDDEEEEKRKDVYLFRIGRIPPYRQMFYQFKDLLVDEAQELIRQSKNTNVTDRCNEKSGWFIPGTDQKLRDLLTKNLNESLAAEKQEDNVVMDSLTDDDDDDDEDDEEDDDFDDPTLTEIKFLQTTSDEDEEKRKE